MVRPIFLVERRDGVAEDEWSPAFGSVDESTVGGRGTAEGVLAELAAAGSGDAVRIREVTEPDALGRFDAIVFCATDEERRQQAENAARVGNMGPMLALARDRAQLRKVQDVETYTIAFAAVVLAK